jgi:hypothetical protein
LCVTDLWASDGNVCGPSEKQTAARGKLTEREEKAHRVNSWLILSSGAFLGVYSDTCVYEACNTLRGLFFVKGNGIWCCCSPKITGRILFDRLSPCVGAV